MFGGLRLFCPVGLPNPIASIAQASTLYNKVTSEYKIYPRFGKREIKDYVPVCAQVSRDTQTISRKSLTWAVSLTWVVSDNPERPCFSPLPYPICFDFLQEPMAVTSDDQEAAFNYDKSTNVLTIHLTRKYITSNVDIAIAYHQ